MDNIEQYLTKAKIEMDKALKLKLRDDENLKRQPWHYQAAIYHVLEANYYQSQAIIELLRERKTE